MSQNARELDAGIGHLETEPGYLSWEAASC